MKRSKRSSSDFSWKESQAATGAYWSFCQKYRKVYSGAVKSLESEIEDLLSFYQVTAFFGGETGLRPRSPKSPDGLVAQDPDTNLIERAFREVKRRPDLWVSLSIETVWNGFSMRSSFTTILKVKRYPLSFSYTE